MKRRPQLQKVEGLPSKSQKKFAIPKVKFIQKLAT